MGIHTRKFSNGTLCELQKRGLVMGNSSSWSSSVVGANDEEPSRGNEVGGEAGAGETRGKKNPKHMGKLEII